MSKDKLLSTILSGVGIASIINAGASVYNNNKKIVENKPSIDRYLNILEEKLALEKYQSGLDPLAPVNSAVKLTDVNSVKSKNNNIVQSGILDEKLDTSPSTDINLNPSTSPLDILEPDNLIYPDINLPLKDNIDPFKWILLSDSLTVTQPLGLSIVGFALMAIICSILIGYNLLMNHHCDKHAAKIPDWLKPFMSIKDKYVLFSNTLYLTILVVSQSLLFAIGVYFYFYGI